MRTKENTVKGIRKYIKNNLDKLSLSGISLIVLVIIIIVIIILATAIILTLNKNNPIEDANKARYESDRDSMQSIFTNTVAKIMTKNQGSINIQAGEINSVKSGVSSTTGEVIYELDNPEKIENKNGKIIFDNKDNTEIEYYTGRKLPIYSAGDTTWYVDEEGIITLKVGKKTYGSGQQNGDGNTSTTPPNESGNGSGISKEMYDELVSKIDGLQNTIQDQNTRLSKLENETILNKREELISREVEIPLTYSSSAVSTSIDIKLSKSIEEYKYLEIQTDIYSNTYGRTTENTNIVAVNSLKYLNSNTVDWNKQSTFLISSKVYNISSFADALAWFKDKNTLHIGFVHTDRKDFTKLIIKKIYGIK